MPQNGLSLGRDISFIITTSTGNLPVTVNATDYNIKQLTKDLKSEPIGSPTIYGVAYDGWSISMKIQRANPLIDQYFAQREADYWAGVNLLSSTIFETIDEPNGLRSQYQYTGVVLKYDEAGDWKSNEFVRIGLSGMASRRIRIV